MNDEIMTSKQVAQEFLVSARAVTAWAKEGRIPYFRTPGGQLRFYRRDVEDAKEQF